MRRKQRIVEADAWAEPFLPEAVAREIGMRLVRRNKIVPHKPVTRQAAEGGVKRPSFAARPLANSSRYGSTSSSMTADSSAAT